MHCVLLNHIIVSHQYETPFINLKDKSFNYFGTPLLVRSPKSLFYMQKTDMRNIYSLKTCEIIMVQ